MKIILTIAIITFATLTSFAQKEYIASNGTVNDSINQVITELKKRIGNHFSFKDIPIDGPLDQFVTNLKKQGFALKNVTDLDAILTGRFTGEDVFVLVQATPKTVYSVTVIYNEQTSWKSIKSQYENMKYMLTARYGEAKETIEEFDSPYTEDSGLELYALNEDKCTYMTHFVTDSGNGMIRLRISPDASLVINYIDTINYLLEYVKAYDDL